MRYSDYECFRFEFDSGVAFVSIDHPPINLLDEVLSQEFDKLGRELEADESVRVVVLQSALPDFFIAQSGLGRVGAASKIVSHTRSFRLTQTIGEQFRNMPKRRSSGLQQSHDHLQVRASTGSDTPTAPSPDALNPDFFLHTDR
jgi:enoyl-CoA hydratase/carnithine racemase